MMYLVCDSDCITLAVSSGIALWLKTNRSVSVSFFLSICLFLVHSSRRTAIVSFSSSIHGLMHLLYPPSERSERGIYCDALIPSVNTQYLDANISKTV